MKVKMSEDYSRTSEGKRKTDRVSGSSSYRPSVECQICHLNDYQLLTFSTSVYSPEQIYSFHQKRWHDSETWFVRSTNQNQCRSRFSVFSNYTVRRLSWWNDIQVELKELGLELLNYYLVRVIRVWVNQVKMIEKWAVIQGKLDSVWVSWEFEFSKFELSRFYCIKHFHVGMYINSLETKQNCSNSHYYPKSWVDHLKFLWIHFRWL